MNGHDLGQLPTHVYTDLPDFADTLLADRSVAWASARAPATAAVGPLLERLFGATSVFSAVLPGLGPWSNIALVSSARESQYDALVALGRQGVVLPDRVLCVAGKGERFHGFRNRPWVAAPGNLHLTARFSPPPGRGDATVGLLALAAVSVIDALDALPGLERRAGIKWVNDVLIDGAKVCGILAHTEAIGDEVVSGIIGIGLNVETTPSVTPTAFVPRVGSLREFSPRGAPCNRADAFRSVAAALSANYDQLTAGGEEELLQRYRERSIVIGRDVAICRESSGDRPEIIAQGTVTGLGARLELCIQGIDEPFDRGRLILGPE